MRREAHRLIDQKRDATEVRKKAHRFIDQNRVEFVILCPISNRVDFLMT